MGGILLLIFGIAFPFLLNYLVIDAAKDTAALKSDNQDMWRGIPGAFDITIDRFTYVYNCTNRDDVNYLLYLPFAGYLQRNETNSAGVRSFHLPRVR